MKHGTWTVVQFRHNQGTVTCEYLGSKCFDVIIISVTSPDTFIGILCNK